MSSKGKGKKGARRPAAVPRRKPVQSATAKRNATRVFWNERSHLFKSTAKNLTTGCDIPPKQNLSRVVRWPKYVRVQRQRAILKKRLRVPPAIAHFAHTLDKNQATNLFRLLSKYRPETKKEKKTRLYEAAKREDSEQGAQQGPKPKHIKFGLKHITELVETRKAKLVVLAHDVDPIELVVWMPALCRKMNVPYCIVKGKARLGQFVHQKTATCLALTEVSKEDQNKLDQLAEAFTAHYAGAALRRWGGGVLGVKTQARENKLQRAREREITSKA